LKSFKNVTGVWFFSQSVGPTSEYVRQGRADAKENE